MTEEHVHGPACQLLGKPYLLAVDGAITSSIVPDPFSGGFCAFHFPFEAWKRSSAFSAAGYLLLLGADSSSAVSSSTGVMHCQLLCCFTQRMTACSWVLGICSAVQFLISAACLQNLGEFGNSEEHRNVFISLYSPSKYDLSLEVFQQ